MEKNGALAGSGFSAPTFAPGKLIFLLLRCILGGLFLYAGIHKALHPEAFMGNLERFRALPEMLIAPTAVYLPYLEILAGLALISGVFYAGGLFLTKGMLVAFSAALALAWWKGLDINCGCFGNAGDLPLSWALARNALLLAICAVLTWSFLRSRRMRLTQGPALHGR